MLADGGSPVADAKDLIRRGNRRLACELLEPWVEAYPEDAAAWSAMAAARFEMGELPEALAASARVVQLRGTARDWCNYGTLLRKIGKTKDAERAQYQALTVDPEYEHARTELGKIHRDTTAGAGEDEDANDFI